MGIGVSADKTPVKWADVEALRQTEKSSNDDAPSGSGCNVRAWVVQSGLQHGCGTVDLTQQNLSLLPECCYVVMMTSDRSIFRKEISLESNSGLDEVCTPRGLSKPWSLCCRSNSIETSIYVLSGYKAGGLVKATALLRGMQLERWIMEKPSLGYILLKNSHPVGLSKELCQHQAWDQDNFNMDDEKAVEQRAREKLQFWSPLCSEILPYLFVGGQTPAEDLETLLHAGITHIINTVEMIVDCCFPEHFSYYPLKMMDTVNEDISVIFPHVIAHIERIRKKKKNASIFIHCQQGASRSCTLIISYILWLEGRTLSQTLDKVKKRRGVAKPNMGFYTRLVQWEAHLTDPDDVSVFRLQGFSPDAPYPHVFAMEKFDVKDGVVSMDTRTVYLLCDKIELRVVMWIGSSCREELVQSARHKAREILKYAFRGLWGDEQVIKETREGFEPADITSLLSGLGLEEPREIPFYNNHYENPARLVEEGENFEESITESDDKVRAREDARKRDVSALHGDGTASMDAATPRLRNQRLDITEMFHYTNGLFKKHKIYNVCPLEEEDFETFSEACSSNIFIFVKQKPSQKLLDVWVGSEHPSLPADFTAKLLSDFSKWASTSTAPSWAASALFLPSVKTTVFVDGQNDDDDDMFYARWVID
eukprot:TRINITY_DN33870_c0_g1_i1.p1 TRINITY_DN33870_c0_g1~~TRINITY_DN33870_c0_g1_i1.p1  ORF type:complete len:669 (+),score=93.09 TRINITY_DN33870_c0_g1_i1:57-2009(+)